MPAVRCVGENHPCCTPAPRGLEFYVNGPGFAVDWEHQFEPGFPLFMQLTRLGQTIFLAEYTGDCTVSGAVYFLVPDVDRCFAAFSGSGVSLTAPPADTPWGTREMGATDPDGNRLRFCEPNTAKSAKITKKLHYNMHHVIVRI